MGYLSINNIQNFVVCSLLVELLGHHAGNVYDLDDRLVLKTTRFYLEVTFAHRAGITILNQFKYHIANIPFHDVFQRKLFFVQCYSILFTPLGLEIH